MNTPICDFVENYSKKNMVRAHMPGHKGESVLGVEHLDITEIKGADSLFECDGIIKESEKNAGEIFSCDTFFSTEGSSLCIRAMLYLALLYAKKEGREPLLLASRNAHKTFLSAVSLLDFDVEWLYSNSGCYLSCEISDDELDKKLSSMSKKPVAFYVTSPDYLGNMADIKGMSEVCKKHSVLLLVDNAHGAYLKFLNESKHPTDFGATMCCDSAHKTLPVLTGGAYLHISKDADDIFKNSAKKALSLFASTSPSYLILQSLDKANEYLSNGFKESLCEFVIKILTLKETLTKGGYTLCGDEELKLTINAKSYGYRGEEIAQILRDNNIECEFVDPDFVVLMLTPAMKDSDLKKIEKALLDIEKKSEIIDNPPAVVRPQKVMSVREAMLSLSQTVSVNDSVGKIIATPNISCPPAVPIIISGERIDEKVLSVFEYYSISECDVVIE